MITSSGWFNISAATALVAFNLATAAPSRPEEKLPMPPSALREPAAKDPGPPKKEDPSGLKYRLLKPTIEPGERTTLEIELPLELLEKAGWNEESGPPLVNDDLLTQAKSFQVLDTTYRHTKESLVWGYELTTHRVGSLTLPPVEIRVGSQTFSTESVELTIATTRAQSDNKIRDEFGPLEMPSRWLYWLMWLSCLPIAYALRRWLEKRLPKWLARFKPKPVVIPPPPPEDPIEFLKRELARLKTELQVNPQETFADDLSAVLREYYSRKHSLPVRAWTTREFSRRFRGEPAADAIVPVLGSCDEVKFIGRKQNLPERFNAALNDTEKALLNVVSG